MEKSKKAELGEYSPSEMMAACGARAIKDRETVFAGTGLPVLAAMLAQKTHAPRSKAIYEGGFIEPQNIDLPLSVADSRLTYRAAAAIGLRETLGVLLQGGRIDIGFLGAAQLDEYGNINTTYIGSLEKPLVRLPGSGGGNDIASCAKRVAIIMGHAKRKLVKKLDYFTSPGHIDGPGGRRRLGLPGEGPFLVVTDLCQMTFDDSTKKIRLFTVHPGVTVEQVLENTGFDLAVPKSVVETKAPTYFELETLRNIDPRGIYIPRAAK